MKDSTRSFLSDIRRHLAREQPQPTVLFRGWVRETGGGTVELLVDRDTGTYPIEGTYVAVIKASTL
jgi:hypothetical protein